MHHGNTISPLILRILKSESCATKSGPERQKFEVVLHSRIPLANAPTPLLTAERFKAELENIGVLFRLSTRIFSHHLERITV